MNLPFLSPLSRLRFRPSSPTGGSLGIYDSSPASAITAATPPHRRAAATAFLAWLIAAAAAYLGVLSIVDLVSGLTRVSFVLGAALAWQIMKRPVLGFILALSIFPWYPLIRAMIMYYRVPAPLELLGAWPEVILLVMLVGIVLRAIREKRALSLSWYDVPVIILLLSALYGAAIDLAARQMTMLVYGFHYVISSMLFYFIARWLRPTRKEVWSIIIVLAAQFTLLALVSLYDYIFRPMYFIQMAMLMRPGFWKAWEPVMFFRWYPRMHSLLFGEALWGMLCAFINLLCLSLSGSGRRAWWYWPLTALSFIGMALSMGRGALVSWVVGIFVLLFAKGRHRRAIAILTAGLIALIVPGVIYLANANFKAAVIVTRIQAMGDPDATGADAAWGRIPQWILGVEEFLRQPHGTGLGTKGLVDTYHGGGGSVWDGGLFKILAEQGIPGIITFLVGAAGCVFAWSWLIRGASGLDRAIGLVAVAFLCGTFVQNIGQNALEIYFVNPLLWMFGGLFVARRLDYRRNSAENTPSYIDIETAEQSVIPARQLAAKQA